METVRRDIFAAFVRAVKRQDLIKPIVPIRPLYSMVAEEFGMAPVQKAHTVLRVLRSQDFVLPALDWKEVFRLGLPNTFAIVSTATQVICVLQAAQRSRIALRAFFVQGSLHLQKIPYKTVHRHHSAECIRFLFPALKVLISR